MCAQPFVDACAFGFGAASGAVKRGGGGGWERAGVAALGDPLEELVQRIRGRGRGTPTRAP